MRGAIPANALTSASVSRSARCASATLTDSNVTFCPGNACPSLSTSALMTVAIFVYPPVVPRSASSTVGVPSPGICTAPAGVPSEMMSGCVR